MVQFPSEVDFVSLLQYSPRGTSPISRRSRDVTYAIKQDGLVAVRDASGAITNVRAIERAAARAAKELPQYACLATCLGANVTLIPMPRRTPLVKDALWPTLRICQCLEREGLAAQVLPCLVRAKPVQRSSTAAPGGRPDPPDHHESVEVRLQQDLFDAVGPRITLVDDVVTRGSTFVGVLPRVVAAFPNATISCFAIVRTQSGVEVDRLIDPVQGKITYHGGSSLHRSP